MSAFSKYLCLVFEVHCSENNLIRHTANLDPDQSVLLVTAHEGLNSR